MFLDFFYNLRAAGVPVSAHNWLALMRALADGLHENTLDGFYQVSRCLLVPSETHYDAFDQAFGVTFRGVQADLSALVQNLDEWLKDPKRLEYLDPKLRAELQALDMDTLRRELLERLEEQKKRHEGGNRWVGTGGTSPFGQGARTRRAFASADRVGDAARWRSPTRGGSGPIARTWCSTPVRSPPRSASCGRWGATTPTRSSTWTRPSTPRPATAATSRSSCDRPARTTCGCC